MALTDSFHPHLWHSWLALSSVALFAFSSIAAQHSQHGNASPFVKKSVPAIVQIGPRLQSVEAPATNLWTFNAVQDYEPEWHTPVFYVTSFVIDEATGNTGQLIELDYLHHRARAWPLPVGIGSWGILKARDGNLYMGSYNGGMLLCFDPHSKRFLSVPQLPEAFRKKEFIVTDLVEAPDGAIYYSTYPGAHLVRYDPKSRKVADLGQASPDEMYIRWLAVTPTGIVLCGMGPRHGRLIAYDPKLRGFRTITPPQYQTPGVFSKPLVTSRFVIEAQHRPGGQILIYDSHTFRLLRVFHVPQRNNGSGNQSAFMLLDQDHVLYQDDQQKLMSLDVISGHRKVIFGSPGTAANNRWYQDARGNLLALLVQSYVYLDRRTGRIIHETIPIQHPAQELRWLSSSPDGLIYGGPDLGQTFFSFNPANHRLISYDQVDDRTGEIYYGISFNKRLYTISYAEAGLSVFDPSKSWNPGESGSSNPRSIAYIPQDQYRPVAGIHPGPGGKLYIGTQPDYGLLGGALSVFDPVTEKLDIYRNLIPLEEIAAIATDDHYVYCAADVQGGAGSKPEAQYAHLFIWDPTSHTILWNHTFSGGQGISALAAANGHVYYVRNDDLMDLDVQARTLKKAYHFNHATFVPSESLKAAKDGTIFGIFGDELGRYDPSTGTMQLFPETLGHASSGLTIDRDGTVYFGNHTSMWIYRPDHPSPPASFGQ